MGKRTLRTLHFEMVAAVLKRRNLFPVYLARPDVIWLQIVLDFADVFEQRAEGFNRAKFLEQCGLEQS